MNGEKKLKFKKGDFVKYNHPNGSIGKIEDLNHYGGYYVRWTHGRDVNGDEIKSGLSSCEDRDLVKISKETYIKARDGRAFGGGQDDQVITLLDESGHEFLERPYSNTAPIEKKWTGGFWFDVTDWGLEIKLDFLGHSKNWSMGSLNIDLCFFSLTLGPIDFFVAYRMIVQPPKGWTR